jgi:hypothetical protein
LHQSAGAQSGRFGITIAAGPAEPAVGWVPLAPDEVYHPHYCASRDYVRNVNVTNVNRTVINNIGDKRTVPLNKDPRTER